MKEGRGGGSAAGLVLSACGYGRVAHALTLTVIGKLGLVPSGTGRRYTPSTECNRIRNQFEVPLA